MAAAEVMVEAVTVVATEDTEEAEAATVVTEAGAMAAVGTVEVTAAATVVVDTVVATAEATAAMEGCTECLTPDTEAAPCSEECRHT